MKLPFEIGTKVRLKKNARVRDPFPGQAEVMGWFKKNSLLALKRDDGEQGGAQNGWWAFDVTDADSLEPADPVRAYRSRKPELAKYL